MDKHSNQEIDKFQIQFPGISYGTLYVLLTLLKHANDPANVKHNVFVINLGTIVRNCLDASLSDESIITNVMLDAETLVRSIGQYNTNKVKVVWYAHPELRQMIYAPVRRPDTKPRVAVERITTKLLARLKVSNNKLVMLPEANANVDEYILRIYKQYAYKVLARYIKGRIANDEPRLCMITHVSLDLLLAEVVKNITLLECHTGKYITREGFGYKVFKTERRSFNRTALKAFGDKDLIKPQIRLTKKNKDKLAVADLSTITEKELYAILTVDLKIDPFDLAYEI